MKSKAIKQIFKIIVAGITSFAILCTFATFYYNISVHYTSETGSTDYKWAKNDFYVKFTEGFAWGHTDKNGFNNAYKDDFDTVDVLFMGSSHIEAFNGQQKYNVVYQMNEIYKENNKDKFVYNIGVSGHTMITCIKNLDAAIKEFKPTDTIVIETPRAHLNEINLKNYATTGELPELSSEDHPLLVALAEIPFVRLMYYQYVSLSRNNPENAIPEVFELDLDSYAEYVDTVLSWGAESAKNGGVELVIVCNEVLGIDENGNPLPDKNLPYLKILKEKCEKHSIKFINMYDDYVAYYEETHRLPHGFSNTAVGTGHINRYGHRLIAQAVYNAIEEEN